MKSEILKKQIGGHHYKDMSIQPIDFILANKLDFCEANAVKYICRWKQKNGIQDIDKAIHYLQILKERIQNVRDVDSTNDC